MKMTVAESIKRFRKNYGVTQKQVADAFCSACPMCRIPAKLKLSHRLKLTMMIQVL